MIGAVAMLLCGGALGWHMRHASPQGSSEATSSGSSAPADPPFDPAVKVDTSPTLVYAHNLLLHKGPDFRVYIVWIRGQMLRTNPRVNPSFDEPESFVLEIDKGIIRANIGDLANFLNASMPHDSPLKNVSLAPNGEGMKLRGTVHKIIPLPVELDGSLAPMPDGRVKFHVNKIDVLKVPVKGLMGGFHMELADVVHVKDVPGLEVVDNDVIFDTRKLLPPPHIHGKITVVKVRPPDIEVVYGDTANDPNELAQWHNFFRLRNGTIDFGKLTMHHVDLTMIDASKDPWFDLDLVNYQAQLVNGYTRMTAQAGMEIYMPDVDEKAPKKMAQSVSLEWLKNRNTSLPADVKMR